MSEQTKRKKSRGHCTLDTRLIALRAQRKIACSFPNQTRRLFLDEITCHLLDILHQLVWHYTISKKRTDYIVKQLIKVNVKLYVIVMSTGLKKQQEESFSECREMLRTAALRLIQHVNSTSSEGIYVMERIQAAIRTAGTYARAIAEGHMSQKSLDKLADVVMFMSDEGFLTALTSKQPPYKDLVLEIAQDLQDSIDRDATFILPSENIELNHEIYDHEVTRTFKFPFLKINVIILMYPEGGKNKEEQI